MGQAALVDGNANRQLCQFGGSVREEVDFEQRSSTDGGRAKGMPRNLFVPLAVFPTNVPLSRVTTGQVLSVEGETKTVVIATQTEKRNVWRTAMTAR